MNVPEFDICHVSPVGPALVTPHTVHVDLTGACSGRGLQPTIDLFRRLYVHVYLYPKLRVVEDFTTF